VDSEVDSDARAEENPAGGQFTNSWALSIRWFEEVLIWLFNIWFSSKLGSLI
jgi:hypothetical protein